MSRIVLALIVAMLGACMAAAEVRFLRVEQTPYRPQAQQFRTFQRQQQPQPATVYGPPEVPELPTTTEPATTTELPTTTEPYVAGQLKEDADVERFDEEGVYYIYHPDGLLQKVVYATRSEDMGYTARLTYKDVEPIKEPIYTYDPQTLAFSRIEV